MNKILEIKFETDWHVGSGAGIPGSIDRTVLRDESGLPYIPGKTLAGILRDSAELVASVRDKAEKGSKWDKALKSLFGGQPAQRDELISAKIGVENAVFSDSLKNIFLCQEGLKQALFIVQPGIKIDRATGRTAVEHLFSREEVCGGSVLRARVNIEGTLSPEEEKLLSDAIKATRRIGGHRRRGAGQCKLSLIDTADGKEGQPARSGQTPDNSEFIELEYVLETLQPVIVNRAALGNVVRSEGYIPGTLLLPFFAKKASAQVGEAISKGEFSVGPFYPESDGRLAYPVPFSYSKEKEGTGKIINRLVTIYEGTKQMKDIRFGFAAPIDGTVVLSSSDSDDIMIYRTHNTVDDEKQHPSEDSGGPYTYEAIKPGLKLRGTIRISGTFWNGIRDKANFINELARESTTSIGQSKKDEYGSVKITFAGISSTPSITGELPSGNDKKKYIVAYLTSDTLVRNESTLAFSGSADDFRDALAHTLGVSLKDVNFDGTNPLGGDRGHCIRFGRRESWHSKWGLPRPSLVYIQAGSVFLFEVMGFDECNFDWNAAEKKLFQGVGDRLSEGYGRVLLNPRFLCDKNAAISQMPYESGKHGAHEQAPLSEEEGQFLRGLKREYVKSAFAKTIRRVVSDYIWNKEDVLGFFENVDRKNAPTASQFGQLREIAAAMSETGDVSPVTSLFDAQASRSQFTRAWGGSWIVWLKKVTGGAIDLWKAMAEDTALDDAIKKDLSVFAISIFLDIFCEAVFDKYSVEGKL
ncbi:MAG: RAMP superfamily CRISPR-associated protein [Synergistaceae bacterium]|jgi:CRISPR-associated protein Csx10|nr:RAMP superfamily CRISPR-associated protein [Synergistaceae bacterium]